MATDVHAPKTYTCPKCGKVHAADLSAMEGHPEIHGKVPCMQCHTLLWISLNEDGTTNCEIYERHLHDVQGGKAAPDEAKVEPKESAKPQAPPPSTAASPPAAATEAASGKSSAVLPAVIAAAVVAGLVSFLVGMMNKGDASSDEPGAGAAASEAMEQRIGNLEAQLAAMRAAAEKAPSAGGIDPAAIQGFMERMEAQGDSVSKLSGRMDAADEAISGVKADFTSLNGRIERNYTTLRATDKRLEALEGK